MKPYYTPLIAGGYYHLFNRAIGKERLFFEEKNYLYFLSRLKQHVLPVADLYAYSLLPNHFHLLVRIKDEGTLIPHFELKKNKTYSQLQHSLPDFVMERFSNCLNAYTKAINKRYNRKGGLFIDYMKRNEADDNAALISFLFYIHKNAVHHGLTKKIGDWAHDSYNSLISAKTTALQRREVVDWFGSVDGFIEFHRQPVGLKAVDLENI